MDQKTSREFRGDGGRLYDVLNLNKAATLAEINERHRALSLLFHPDKQQDPNGKDAATELFLDVQKAYQVLSDPFLREVYDILGEQGLSIKWSENLVSRSKEEIREELRRIQADGFTLEPFDPDAAPNTRLIWNVDGTPLSGRETTLANKDKLEGVIDRLQNIWLFSEELHHDFRTRINNETTLAFETRTQIKAATLGSVGYAGTIRHQFSPRFSGKASIAFGKLLITRLQGTYRDDDNVANLKLAFSPVSRKIIPNAEISLSRRLFRLYPQRGEIKLDVRKNPSISFNYVSPPSLTKAILDANDHGIQSVSGLRFALFDRTFGVAFSGILPRLVAEFGVTFIELATRLKVAFELGINGLAFNAGAHWAKPDKEADIFVAIHSRGIVLQTDLTYSKQRFSMPILLSTEYNPYLALCTLIIPSTAAVIGYQLILKPRRRARRLAQIQAARKLLEEDIDSRKKRKAVVDLLRPSAQKITSSESTKGGLVIQEAFYGVQERASADDTHDLTVNVTIPLQALVRHSQLYIAGDSSKSNLQGFFDPAPFTSKMLRIRYLFRGRSHYAEIPDYFPVVLPLSEHLVEQC